MIYVMSDIHGEYQKYVAMLEKINFNDNDMLYILGDVIDRGEHGIQILQDMMMRSNVFPILGNHEYMARHSLGYLLKEITEETLNLLDNEVLVGLRDWMSDGGIETLNEFLKLSKEERQDIIEYIDEFPLYEIVNINNKVYILVHAGLGNFSPKKSLDDYSLDELLWYRCDFSKPYFEQEDIFVVSGHTPTMLVSGKSEIYYSNQHILIDCGAPFNSGRLACLCLDTMEEYYV